MTPKRRNAYFEVMDLTLWRPHTQLPGAKPSLLVGRKALVSGQSQAAIESSRPGHSRSSPVAKPQKTRMQTAASILAAEGTQTRKPAGSKVQAAAIERLAPQIESRPSAPQSTVLPVNTNSDTELSLCVVECPGELLIIDSAAADREHHQLLRNLMFAITGVPATKYRITPLNSRSLGSNQGSLSDLAFGMVERAAIQNRTQQLILMGEEVRGLFGHSESGSAAEGAHPLSSDIAVVLTHSSEQLLRNPDLKRETWAQVQPLCKK
ncbi:MAG: hypothetical protein AB8B86_14185 [Pseudomonadales bacterium]